MEKMIAKKMKEVKGLFGKKNLPGVIILVIILFALYFVGMPAYCAHIGGGRRPAA